MPDSRLKLLLVEDDRPNSIMKVAPIIQQIVQRSASGHGDSPRLDYRLIHTGQHYDSKMSDVSLDDLGIAPAYINLCVGSDSHAVEPGMRLQARACLRARETGLNRRGLRLTKLDRLRADLASSLGAAGRTGQTPQLWGGGRSTHRIVDAIVAAS